MTLDRNSVLSALGSAYTNGCRVTELAAELKVKKHDVVKLRRILASLVTDGLVTRLARGVYAVADSSDDPQVVGRISVHPAGYGFVTVDDGSDDVFVPAKYRGAAMDGDRVVLSTWDGYKGTEGRVVQIVSRGRAKLTGVLRRTGRTLFLEPDDPRISTDYGQVWLGGGTGGAQIGEAVVVEISDYPTKDRPRIAGRVSKVLGDPDDPRTEIAKIITCADIPEEFPSDASALAKATSQEVLPADLADRIDLRDRPFVTIDPVTARDFDDALCLDERPGGGVRVWIAVADVSHYVRTGDALDREAAIRSVSVYLPDKVIPMLPFELSSGICSLNPEVDRCAMVVRLDFDDEARIVDRGYAAAVIRSQARLDYPGTAAALTGDFRGRRGMYRPWAATLGILDALAQKMRVRRMARGSLQLDLPEPKVILDDDDPRLVRDVVRAKGDEGVKRAYQLVEEFMIAANEAVGRFFRERDLDTVWRAHAPPKREKIEDLAAMFEPYGIDVDIAAARTPLGMREVLEQAAELPASRSLTFLVLRSLKQAVYQTENVGHFGLASEEYLHFTSPIRRYPDLLAHRLLKYYLHREGQASGNSGALLPPSKEQLGELAATSSANERRAMEAEREAVSMYRAYLMREQVGEQFTGRVTGVTSFGAFVELDDPFVEGLIKLESLDDDYYDFDKLHMELVGRRGGNSVCLGDAVVVEILGVSVPRRRIELGLVELVDKARKTTLEKTTRRGAQPGRRRAKVGDREARRKPKPARASRGSATKKRGKAGTKRGKAAPKRGKASPNPPKARKSRATKGRKPATRKRR